MSDTTIRTLRTLANQIERGEVSVDYVEAVTNPDSHTHTMSVIFSRRLEEPRRHIGQRYTHTPTGDEYLLACASDLGVNLVDLSIGDRWNDPVHVKAASDITAAEWDAITDGGASQFELQE